MKKQGGKLTILEAVDNLSTLAELDSPPSGDEQGNDWSDESQVVQNQERVKQTFRVINDYLHHIYEKNQSRLREPETQRGIQAMMVLAGEAAQKLDKYSLLFKGAHGGSVTHIKEYQDLQKFYLNKIMRRFQESLESEAAFEAEWKTTSEGLDLERQGVKNLETVRRDREYELFYIKNEDGTPFFNRHVLRHIQLIGQFDEGFAVETGDSPLLKFQFIQDRDLQATAKEILQLSSAHVTDFYSDSLREKGRSYVAALNMTLMALMLAKNIRHLIQNTTGKSCGDYFRDFHAFLRESLQAGEYNRLVEEPRDKLGSLQRTQVMLTHVLACSFFMRTGTRSESIAHIRRLINMEGKPEPKELVYQPIRFWNSLLEDDEHIRQVLNAYPNGPILKALEYFKEGSSGQGYDPLSQGNYPMQICSFVDETTHTTLIRLPSPTIQHTINVAEVAPEFRGFLRYLSGKNQKHLLINMQDRTSWQEHARCLCLEKLQIEEEFRDYLAVFTLPKHTDFYLQIGPYQNLNDADTFIQTFKDQIHHFEECGFYFPPAFRTKELTQFLDTMMAKIHHFFFLDHQHLSHKNRADFIEILYQFLILKMMEWVHPDTMSFTCKDAVDTGAAANATFFAFLRMMGNPENFSTEDKDQLLWLFFNPALTIRDRSIEIQRFNRSISCLAQLHTEIETQRDTIVSAFNEYYAKPFLTSLKIQLPNS